MLSVLLYCYTGPNPNSNPHHESTDTTTEIPQSRSEYLSQPRERAETTRKKREIIAQDEFEVGPTCHITNGDEDNESLEFAGNYHKTLPHDRFGRVSKRAYRKLLKCVRTADINDCEEIPSGGGKRGAKLTNPLGGTVHQVDGPDSDSVFIAPPDSLLSERLALPSFKGLNIPRSKYGNIIDPVTDLFRTDWPGVTTGPVVSQFLLSDFLIDSIRVEPKAAPLQPKKDYMTAFRPWLDVQNGNSDVETIFDTENPRFIRNGRDLATIAFADQLYTEAFRAALILFTQGVLGGEVGAYAESKRQMGFATFGEPHILTAMAASSSSTRHAWYQKWQVHRLLRPEAYGGLVHNTLMKNVFTPLPDSLLKNMNETHTNHSNDYEENTTSTAIMLMMQELLHRVEVHNKDLNPGSERTFLLPMAVAEGSPTHPAYPSGHAINNGAYITTLKAFVGFEAGQRCFPNPVISNDEGTKRIPYVPSGRHLVGECTNEKGRQIKGLTIEGELNKVSANVLLGRSHLGVHWRMDGVNGALEIPGLPEARFIEDRKRGDLPTAMYKFRLYSGKMLELYGRNLFKLDDNLCQGAFTGDDFCDEVNNDAYDSFEDIVEDLGTFETEL
eukprot:jgi/Undpi1/12565/HiC_scaffold_6.g02234.m1